MAARNGKDEMFWRLKNRWTPFRARMVLMHTNVLARDMAIEAWLADVEATRYLEFFGMVQCVCRK